MKTLNCKLCILLFVSLLLSSSLHANKVKKELHKEFSTNQSSAISFDTKFGSLIVENWDKNQVLVDVIITAEHSDKVKANKLLDLITVNFETNGNKISVRTEVDKKISKGNFGKEKKFNIIITAKVPTGIEFSLDNNYGTAEIQKLSGPVSIENNYGTLEIESLTGDDCNIEVNYGDTQIGQLVNGSLEVNYGKAIIQQSNNINMDVNSGNMRIGTALTIVAEINMSELIIDKMDEAFKSVDIESNMSHVEIGIDKNAGFTLSSEMHMGNIEYPSGMTNLKKKKDHMNSSVEGTYGNGQSKITLEGSMGNIELRLK